MRPSRGHRLSLNLKTDQLWTESIRSEHRLLLLLHPSVTFGREIFNPAHTQPLDTLEKRCISSYLQRGLCCYGDQGKEVAKRLIIGNSFSCIQDAV